MNFGGNKAVSRPGWGHLFSRSPAETNGSDSCPRVNGLEWDVEEASLKLDQKILVRTRIFNPALLCLRSQAATFGEQ